MKKQAYNPYLPSYEYIPDGEPHIFDGRVYVYGSHDRFNGKSFCLNDYVCWSAPVDNLSDWRYEGVIYKKNQDPRFVDKPSSGMAAPDVCRGLDGKYYLYYFSSHIPYIAVAVCDTPAGKYEYYGYVKYADGVFVGDKDEPYQFDPGIFIDDDGKIYLYTGFGPKYYPSFLRCGRPTTKHGAMCFELKCDMLTAKNDVRYIGVLGKGEAKGTPYEGHEFFEASSMRKFEGRYYFIYSAYKNHELCYAVSDSPTGGFEYGGTLVSIGDVGISGRTEKNPLNYLGNTHGSAVEINGEYYVFYHRHSNRHWYSRQACAERLIMKDGKLQQAEVTSCGLNGAPLMGEGEYPAYIACNLFGKKGAYYYSPLKDRRPSSPYFTQSGEDREDNPDQHIANFCDGATAGFKYFDIKQLKRIGIRLNGKVDGKVIVKTALGGDTVCEIATVGEGESTYFGDYMGKSGVLPLYFTYVGKGRPQFISFSLIK